MKYWQRVNLTDDLHPEHIENPYKNQQQRDNNPIFKKNQRLHQTPYGRSNNTAYAYIKVSQHLNHQGKQIISTVDTTVKQKR